MLCGVKKAVFGRQLGRLRRHGIRAYPRNEEG